MYVAVFAAVVAAVTVATATDTSLLLCSFSTRLPMSWRTSFFRQQHRNWWTLWWQLNLAQQQRTPCSACLLSTWCRTTVLSCRHTGAYYFTQPMFGIFTEDMVQNYSAELQVHVIYPRFSLFAECMVQNYSGELQSYRCMLPMFGLFAACGTVTAIQW